MSEQAMIVLIVLLTVVSLALAFILISLLSQMRSIRSQVHFISRNETRKRLTFYGKSRSFRRLASDINEILDSYDERHEKILREDKEIKDTLTNMSHDIRTPLTSLKGYFELLEQTDDPEEKEVFLHHYRKDRFAVRDPRDDVLYTKVSNVNFKISIDPIECSKIILETLFEYYDDFQDKGFEVDVDVDEGIRILGNEQSLKRIMQNLIRNSLVHGGGDVKLSVKRDEQGKKVVITLDNLLLEGQNPDPQKVFDRYYKGDASRHTGSSGVGLSVVKKLVESMSGDISAVVSDGRFKIAMSL